MKNTKKQFERFAFYDKTAIEEKLEAMAAQGWLIEQPGNYRWCYRRIEPKKLHIAVTYFPNASDFDPGPTEGQQQMEEFCARDGWVLAARWGQMQIFYNEREDPTPIETDPVTQVETIHRAMKKNMLPTHFLLAFLCLYQLIFIGWRLSNDPVEFLSTPSSLFMLPAWLLILLPTLLEICGYFRWYRRAKKEAENGLFYELKTNHTASLLLYGASVLTMVLVFGGAAATRWSLLAGFCMVLMVVSAVWIAKSWMKKKGFSRNANRTLSISVSIVLTLVLMVLLTAAIIRTGFTGGSSPVGTYDMGGWEMDVYADSMPLYVQELTDTNCDDWSTKMQKDETFLLSYTEYRQRGLTMDRNVPDLEYAITEVKADFLYDYCKNSLIGAREDEVIDGEVVLADHYESIDASPWGAAEAYRLYWSDSYLNRYLLCYENRIVEIRFDWEPTAEQMALVTQRLGHA